MRRMVGCPLIFFKTSLFPTWTFLMHLKDITANLQKELEEHDHLPESKR